MTEMLVVVGIIGVLLLLGISVYMGTQRDSQDNVARSNLRRMATTQALFRSGYGYYGTQGSQFDQLPEGLTLVEAPASSSKPSEISAAVDLDGNLGMAAWSDATETCLWLHMVGGKDDFGQDRSAEMTEGQVGGPDSGFAQSNCTGQVALDEAD